MTMLYLLISQHFDKGVKWRPDTLPFRLIATASTVLNSRSHDWRLWMWRLCVYIRWRPIRLIVTGSNVTSNNAQRINVRVATMLPQNIFLDKHWTREKCTATLHFYSGFGFHMASVHHLGSCAEQNLDVGNWYIE